MSAFTGVESLTGSSSHAFTSLCLDTGIFSVLPAYIADLFGQKHAGAIHGKGNNVSRNTFVCNYWWI